MQDDSGSAPPLLVRLYFARRVQLARFFTARSGSATEAEDLMQELYLKVIAAPATGIANGPAYLYQLSLRLYQDRYRAQKRRAAREDKFSRDAQANEAFPDAARAPTPEQEVEWRLWLEQVLAAVETLPPQCRQVFRLHKLDGLDHQSVAKAMGISRSSVEKHMIAALRHLARKLDLS